MTANEFEDSILIEELPVGAKLFYRADGSVVIAGTRKNGNPLLYTVTPKKNLKHYTCQVRRMTGSTTLLEDVAPARGTHGIPDEYPYEPLLPTLFPSIDQTTLKVLSGMGNDIALELAACLATHPTIYARHYPIQYVALLLWSDNSTELLSAIEMAGGNITTQHLCQALGIPKLTTAMKRFIRLTKPQFCKETYIQTVTGILGEWDDFRRIFNGCNEKAIDLFDLEAIYQNTQCYPALLNAKWYQASKLVAPECFVIGWPEWIERAYTFYLESRNSTGKPIPETAADIDVFLCRHIRSCQQLQSLMNQAESVFTQESDQWLLNTYPDDLAFDHLPDITDTHLFRLIRTAGELRDMAKKLNNCAAGLLHEAVRGSVVFFAYEYTPDKYPGGPIFDDPDYPVTGLLALRRAPLDHWMKTGEAPDWIDIERKLILEFKGFRNAEPGPAAWRHLENFLCFSIANVLI